MNSFLQELRVAARQLAGRKSFSLIVVATIALGIGATTTCFALLNGVAFSPIPFAEPDRLVGLRAVERGRGGTSQMSLAAFAALEATHGSFAGAVAYTTRDATIAAPGLAERVEVASVSGDVFSLLGVPLQRGRALTAADAGTRVAVIGHDLWTRDLASNPQIVGSTIALDGETYVVVGGGGPGFAFPGESRVWVPLGRTPLTRSADVVARLAPGVTPAQADATLAAVIGGARSAADPSIAAPVTTPLRQLMIGTKQRDMALILLCAAALVLVVACVNLAGLLAAQIAARRFEMAVRAAIGAHRGRLVRQLMTESAMLAAAGGLLGLLLAQWGIALLSATLGAPQGAEWIVLAIDGRVVMFAAVASLAAARVFGLAPAIAGTRADLRGVLQGAVHAPVAGRRRMRGFLVGAQLAVSVALVSGAASIVASSIRLDAVDPGFDRKGILSLSVAFAGPAYAQPEQRFAFIDAATGRLRSLSGTVSVTAASHLPLIDRNVPFAAFAPDGAASERTTFGSIRFVDAGYLAAMDIPIRRGRAFTAAEARATRDRTIVINDTMARRYWPDRDPIGTRVRLTAAPEIDGWYTVVGVAGDISQRQLPAAPENQMYLPLAPAREVSLVVRTASDPAAAAAQAREAVQGLDPAVAITTHTMQGAYAWYARDRRMQGLVVGGLGAVAMLLAGLGVYGVMSILVSARNREIAIRLALGSSAGRVLRLTLAQGMTIAAGGIVTGLVLAIAMTAFLASIFTGVRGFDATVLGGAVAALGAVALLASWWPARRAMRVDPMVTLKQ
jgi:predicted permease